MIFTSAPYNYAFKSSLQNDKNEPSVPADITKLYMNTYVLHCVKMSIGS